MKLLSSIKVSYSESSTSFELEGLHYSKVKIFDKESIKEALSIINGGGASNIDDGKFKPVNIFDHLFGDDRDRSKKLIFALSCLKTKNGQQIFQITNMSGLLGIISIDNNKLTDISELNEVSKPKVDTQIKAAGVIDKPKKDEPKDDKIKATVKPKKNKDDSEDEKSKSTKKK